MPLRQRYLARYICVYSIFSSKNEFNLVLTALTHACIFPNHIAKD